jgi:hypothetical protein
MCNKFHDRRVVPIPENGVGYKIFRIIEGKLLPLIRRNDPYRVGEDGYARWEESEPNQFPMSEGEADCGFCFFPDEKEALEVKRYYQESQCDSRYVVRKIRYEGAIRNSSFVEKGMVGSPVQIALCKSFRPVRGWNR